MPQPVPLGAFLEVEDERFDAVSLQECRLSLAPFETES